MAADRGRTWTDEEVALLLEAWSSEYIQEQLRGALRNEVPFRKIADKLADAEYHRSSKQCREKIKSLKKKYKEVVDRLRRSGVGLESDDEEVTVRDFKWFNELHAVMKGRPVSNPQYLQDSAKASSSTPSSAPCKTATGSCTDIPVLNHSEVSSDDESKTSAADLPPKQKKRKLSKLEKAENASNALMEREERARIEDERDKAMLNMFTQLLDRLAPPPHQDVHYLPPTDSMYCFPED